MGKKNKAAKQVSAKQASIKTITTSGSQTTVEYTFTQPPSAAKVFGNKNIVDWLDPGYSMTAEEGEKKATQADLVYFLNKLQTSLSSNKNNKVITTHHSYESLGNTQTQTGTQEDTCSEYYKHVFVNQESGKELKLSQGDAKQQKMRDQEAAKLAEQPKQHRKRPIKSLFDCSPSLQKVFKEDLKHISNEDKQNRIESSIKEISQLCNHQATPAIDPLEEDFQIEESWCFFVCNEHLWTQLRPSHLKYQSVCYGFDPTKDMGLTPAQLEQKQDYFLMIDINRLLLLTTPYHNSRLCHKSSFQDMLVEVCKIVPHPYESKGAFSDLISDKPPFSFDTQHLFSQKFSALFSLFEQVESKMKRNHKYDSGLSQQQMRESLVFALLQTIHQIRGLLLYRLLKIMVIVGHNDIECCYLMPSEPEESTGVLADEYYQSLIKLHSHKIHKRRQKLIYYLESGYAQFQKKCVTLIRLGIMDSLFSDFDFFSTSSETGKRKQRKPEKSEDMFGDVSYSYRRSRTQPQSDSSSEDVFSEEDSLSSSSSETQNLGLLGSKSHSNKQTTNYEIFLFGFFYFFILMDPYIRHYLELNYESTNLKTNKILQDLKEFQDKYMLQWVQIMVKLDIFKSTSKFKWSKALQFLIEKVYYDNLKTAQIYKMKKANEQETESEGESTAQSSNDESPFQSKYLPPLVPTKDVALESLYNSPNYYLCQDCCSIRITRQQSTLHGSLDIITVYAGGHPQIIKPPKGSNNECNFQITSFVCKCKKKALICETDLAGQQRFERNRGRQEDQQLYEMLQASGGMIYRCQRVLQIKTLKEKMEPRKQIDQAVYMPRRVGLNQNVEVSDLTEIHNVESKFAQYHKKLLDSKSKDQSKEELELLQSNSLQQKIKTMKDKISAFNEYQQKESQSLLPLPPPALPSEQPQADDTAEKKKKKSRKKNRRRKKKQNQDDAVGDKSDDEDENTLNTSVKSAQAVDSEFDKEVEAFKKRLESCAFIVDSDAPDTLIKFTTGFKGFLKPNVSRKWLHKLKLRLKQSK